MKIGLAGLHNGTDSRPALSAPQPTERWPVSQANALTFAQRHLAAIVASMALLAAMLLAVLLAHLRSEALAAGARLTESVAQIVEEQTTRAIQSVDQGLQLTAIRLLHLKPPGTLADQAARELLLMQLQERPFLHALWLFDAQGHIVADTSTQPARQELAKRSYYQRHLSTAPTGLFVGAPELQADGEWLLHLARAVQTEGGQNQGMLVAATRPDYFDALWRTMSLGTDGSIALLRRDGLMLLRSPFIAAAAGQDFSARPLFRQLLPERAAGRYTDTSSVDGVMRTYAYRTLAERPDLVVVVGQSHWNALKGWRQIAMLATLAWFAVAALAVASALWLQRAWRAHAALEVNLRESEERYRCIFESSMDALLLTTPDGRVLDANAATCAMFGRTLQEIKQIGRSGLLEAGDPRLAEALRQRDLTGRFQGELTLLRRDGERFEGDVSTAVFQDHQGQHRTSMVIRDISARKRTESALRETALQLKELSRRVLDAQEAERRHIARELHDELGQALTAIKINLQAGKRVRNQAPDGIEVENVRIIDNALGQIRRLALTLRPSMLDDLGLVPALRWLTEQTQSRGKLDIAFHVDLPKSRLAPEIETACFRIAQEALTNIVRHADAKHVTVDLHTDGGTLELRIHDDGRGFDTFVTRAKAAAGESIGVLGMQERATLLGGELRIDSVPAQGSTVWLRCPMRLKEETA